MWNVGRILLQVLLIQSNFDYVRATWPPPDPSSVQLVGLFPDALGSTTTSLSVHSRAMFQASVVLARRYNISVGQQSIGWQSIQTGGDSISALSGTCQSVSTSNVVGVIGPALSREATTVGAFAKRVGIPVISYSATDPNLSDRISYPTFYRTVSSDSIIALTMVELFVRFDWQSCIILFQNDAFGTNGMNAIDDAFNKYGVEVIETLAFDIATLSIRGNLKDVLLHTATRLVVVWVETAYTPLIIQTALDNDLLGPHFVWIFSSSVSLDSFNATSYEKLIGVLTIEPAVGNQVAAPINSTLLNAAYEIWQQYEPETFPGVEAVNSYALLAFDATWLLIQSLQEYCSLKAGTSSSSCLSTLNATNCFDSRLAGSDSLLKTIARTEFLGVSGAVQYNANNADRNSGMFYMVRNIQTSSSGIDYVPVLKWTSSAKWEMYTTTTVMIWPGNTLTVPSGFPKLTGITVRIGVIESPPFLMTRNVVDEYGQNRTDLVGFIPDLITRLRNLTGFIPEVLVAPSNQSYGGMVQAVVDNKYDIVVGDITVTAARREIVDFSTPIFDNTFSIILRKTTAAELDFFSYLKPFSRSVWLTLLAACVYASILVWLLERSVNEALRDRSIMSSAAMSIWYSLGTILGYGADFAVQTAAGRLLTVALYILSIILLATYTANLASDLTILKSKNIIDGIEDLKNGMISFNRIGILVNSSFEDYFVREVSFGGRNFYQLKKQDEIYTNLLDNRIDVSIMDTGILQYVTNALYCDLTLVGAPFNPNSYAVVIPKQWIYTRVLDVNILSLKEAGFLDELRQKWFEANTCSDSSSSDQSTAISIESLSGLFLTFFIITLLSLLLFAWTKRVLIAKYVRRLVCGKELTDALDNVSAAVSTLNPSELARHTRRELPTAVSF